MRKQLLKLAGAACLGAGIMCAGEMVLPPLNAYAQETEDTQEIQEVEVIGNDEPELVATYSMGAFSGKFGKNSNLRWNYNETNKTVTITGEDYMACYDYKGNAVKYGGFDDINKSAEHIVFKNCLIMDANLEGFFSGFSELKDIDFSGLTVTNILNMYQYYDGLISIRNMFNGCKKLSVINFSDMNIDFSNYAIYDVEAAFGNCSSLEKLDLGSLTFNVSYSSGSSEAFYNCNNLKILVTPKKIVGPEVKLTKTFYENNGTTYHTRLSENNQGMTLKSRDCNGWSVIDGKYYWYENAVRQGTEGRGREIYDPDSDAWYWLDAVQDGAKAVSKDVYQESYAGQWGDIPGEDGATYGKWVRYDSEGHMIKGWDKSSNGKNLNYFEQITGAMVKGWANIDGEDWYFDEITGIAHVNGWDYVDGRYYWYENGVKQGTEGRGKEIYDPDSDAWYWLDAVQGGAKAVSKDVYQESNGGKWVRYDANGGMIKGWSTSYVNGRRVKYYFDPITGAMAKGWVDIDGTSYYFDETTGICADR